MKAGFGANPFRFVNVKYTKNDQQQNYVGNTGNFHPTDHKIQHSTKYINVDISTHFPIGKSLHIYPK